MCGIDGQGVAEDMGYEGHLLATRNACLVKYRLVRRREDELVGGGCAFAVCWGSPGPRADGAGDGPNAPVAGPPLVCIYRGIYRRTLHAEGGRGGEFKL